MFSLKIVMLSASAGLACSGRAAPVVNRALEALTAILSAHRTRLAGMRQWLRAVQEGLVSAAAEVAAALAVAVEVVAVPVAAEVAPVVVPRRPAMFNSATASIVGVVVSFRAISSSRSAILR